MIVRSWLMGSASVATLEMTSREEVDGGGSAERELLKRVASRAKRHFQENLMECTGAEIAPCVSSPKLVR